MGAAVVLDSNVILRHLLADHEELSAKADEILEPIKDGRAHGLVPEAVFAECVFVLEGPHRVTREVIAEWLSRFLGYRGLIGEHLPVLRETLLLYANSNVSFVDVLALVTARRARFELVTFDASRMAESR
jgi:predicted nucleic acid-binding protein